MKNRIDNFLLEGWIPTPVEQSLMDGTFKPSLNESMEACEEIPQDFLEIQDFNTAMEEIKSEINKWQSSSQNEQKEV